MAVTRRALCLAGAATALGAALTGVLPALAGCGSRRYAGPARPVTIAGGQLGGFYLGFADKLAHEVGAAEPDLRCEVIGTGGSVNNIELIRDGFADVGLCQADIALAALGGQSPFEAAWAVCGIGRLYEDYLQLVVLEDSPYRSVADLAGRTVSIGPIGSGTAIFGERLFAAAGVRVLARRHSLEDAISALRRGRVEAMLWCGGVPTPALRKLHAQVPIRLLPIADALPVLRTRYGSSAYQQVNIPPGGYGQAGTPTIGVANLLLCAENLPDDVVAAITATVVERGSRMVSPEALGAQFLDRRTLIGLLGVPMHPGAVSAYRQLHG